jgi:hypothetical protein
LIDFRGKKRLNSAQFNSRDALDGGDLNKLKSLSIPVPPSFRHRHLLQPTDTWVLLGLNLVRFFGRFRRISSNCRPALPSSPSHPHSRYDLLASRSFSDTCLHCTALQPRLSAFLSPIVTNRPSLATELYISYPRSSRFCLVSYSYLSATCPDTLLDRRKSSL